MGLLNGDIKGDVAVTVHLDPQSLVLMAILVIAIIAISIMLKQVLK